MAENTQNSENTSEELPIEKAAALVEKVSDKKMPRRDALKFGAGLTALLALGAGATGCKQEVDPKTKAPLVPDSAITAGKFAVFYNQKQLLLNDPDALAAAKKYDHVILQPNINGTNPSFFSAQDAIDAGLTNAVGYMSGISLDPNNSSLATLRSYMDAHDGWLKDKQGNKVLSTGGSGYLVDIRKPHVAKQLLSFGLQIGKEFPKGLIVDEADQAIYAEDTHPEEFKGLTQAYAQLHNDLAIGIYYNTTADDIYPEPATGDVNAMVRKSVITLVDDPKKPGQKVAQRKDPATGAITTYTPTYHPTDILSGIQPSTSNLANIVARYAGYSGCTETLESRFYERAGVPNSAEYRNTVKNQIIQVARAAKDAGRSFITFNLLEPAFNTTPENKSSNGYNTAASYKQAGEEVALWAKDIINTIKSEVGINTIVNLDIVECDPTTGLFNFNTTKDFQRNLDLKNDLKNSTVLKDQGIDVQQTVPAQKEVLRLQSEKGTVTLPDDGVGLLEFPPETMHVIATKAKVNAAIHAGEIGINR